MTFHRGQRVRLLWSICGVSVDTTGVIEASLGKVISTGEPMWVVHFQTDAPFNTFGVYESWLKATGPRWFDIWGAP